jgi:hypothetical protein
MTKENDTLRRTVSDLQKLQLLYDHLKQVIHATIFLPTFVVKCGLTCFIHTIIGSRLSINILEIIRKNKKTAERTDSNSSKGSICF